MQAPIDEPLRDLLMERTPKDFTFNIKAYSLLTEHPTKPDSLYKDVQEMVPEEAREKTPIARWGRFVTANARIVFPVVLILIDLRGAREGVWQTRRGADDEIGEPDAAPDAVAEDGRDIPTAVVPRRAGDPAVLIASSARIARDLGWQPRVGMRDALKLIFDAYRTQIAEARHLVQ